MKVIVTGAQCTGKTTLIDGLDERYKPLVVKEHIRELCRRMPTVQHDLQSDDFSQELFFSSYYFTFSKMPRFISDRGMVDVLAYTNYFVLRGQCSAESYLTMVELYKMIIADLRSKNQMPTYVYVPIEFDAREDGFRCTDEEYRRYVDHQICNVLSSAGIEPLVIRGPKEVRQQMFNDLVRSLDQRDRLMELGS